MAILYHSKPDVALATAIGVGIGAGGECNDSGPLSCWSEEPEQKR